MNNYPNLKHYLTSTPKNAAGYAYSSIVTESNNFTLLIVKDLKRAEELEEQFNIFAGKNISKIFSSWDCLPFELVSPSINCTAQRIEVLHYLKLQKLKILICTASGILQKNLPRNVLENLTLELKLNSHFEIETFISHLEASGYKNVSLAQSMGEYALRGNVIDLITPLNEQNTGFRVEFNDKITQLKIINCESQRSVESQEKITILPVQENIFYNYSCLKNMYPDYLNNLNFTSELLNISPRIKQAIINSVTIGENLPGKELLSIAGTKNYESIFEYLPKNFQVIIEDQNIILKTMEDFIQNAENRLTRQLSKNFIFPSFSGFYLSAENFLKTIENKKTFLNFEDNLSEENNLNFYLEDNYEIDKIASLTQNNLDLRLNEIKLLITKKIKEGFKILIFSNSSDRVTLLQNKLINLNLDCQLIHSNNYLSIDINSFNSNINITIGHLEHGFKNLSSKIIFLTESEILGINSKRSGKKSSINIKKIMTSLKSLKDGDYVVHEDYGIGIYQGLQKISVEDKIQEFIQINYADSKLFLPIQNIGRIQKYSTLEDKIPEIDKLSSQKWQKTKQNVKKSVAEIAGDLIKLYAAREMSKGFAYPKFNTDDQNFAESFAFDETQDQLNAIEESLTDLSKEKPMDRLICGDVGFGKTEVAIRAAFKVVQSGKQVAVFVPTTVLVDQHKENFTARLSAFGIRVGAISRFYSKTSNNSTIDLLKNGKIEIIIGTQALLGKKVNFYDLGLVIIDEEHRFGVKQKEALKKIKTQIDVLTLTATPIPRTLHMSLLGIRDISVISTPPHQRQVTKTFIALHDPNVIKDAIFRELERGGQVFFLHNRVQNIEEMSFQIREMFPTAKISIAHGQMKPAQLEDAMHKFIRHESDILVCTTIIESGIDIPNANTIIINRADTLGLAQLYQLRGRVGRSNKQAYCYLLAPSIKNLSYDAHERLKALKEIDDLGRGFNLALRDLEIRGAGNILGKEQSGTVSTVGYDLYIKILREAIYILQGQNISLEEIIDPEVKIPINAFIPDFYIPDVSERLVLYQRLSSIQNSLEAKDLYEEIMDRFGKIPNETENLYQMMLFRSELKKFAVIKLEISGQSIKITFSEKSPLNPKKIINLVTSNKYHIKLTASNLSIKFSQELAQKPIVILYDYILDLLSTLCDFSN